MFVRGSGSGEEFRRIDNSFYRGIVVKNNDPSKLNRVKVFIPELSSQPYDDWYERYDEWSLKAMGLNLKPLDDDEIGDFSDIKMFNEICNIIPWAEPCFPLIGESGNFRFYKDGEISTVSDCNYVDGFQVNDEEPTSIEIGSFSPAYLWECLETSGATRDSFNNPIKGLTVKNNPYSYQYRPSKHVNKTKGWISIPEVGAKVWVFHWNGDLNFPIYFGVNQDFRSLTIMNDTDNEQQIGPVYPNEFEN